MLTDHPYENKGSRNPFLSSLQAKTNSKADLTEDIIFYKCLNMRSDIAFERSLVIRLIHNYRCCSINFTICTAISHKTSADIFLEPAPCVSKAAIKFPLAVSISSTSTTAFAPA